MPWIAAAAVVLSFFVRTYIYVSQNASPMLYWDQWDYLPRIAWEDSFHWVDLFTQQFGPHRLGLGFIMTTLLGQWTGYDIRVEALASVWIFVLCGFLALWLKYRITKDLKPIDLFLLILPINLAQAEIFIAHSSFYMGSVPQLLILGMAHFLVGGLHRTRELILFLILNLLCVFSGFAFFAGLASVAILIISLCQQPSLRGRVKFGMAGILAVGTLLWFFQGYQFRPAVSCYQFPHSKPWEYPIYMAFMYGRFIFEGSKGLPLIMGFITLIGLMWSAKNSLLKLWPLRNPQQSTYFPLIFIFLYTGLYISATAIGRVCLGVAQGSSSRYLPYVVPSIMALWIMISLSKNRRKEWLLITIVSIFMIAEYHWRKRDMGNTFTYYIEGKKAWMACYLKQESVLKCDKETGFYVYPPGHEANLEKKIDVLRRKKWSLYKERANYSP